jgi:hypothetical protein
MTTDRTVTIRPGTYERIEVERPNGDRWPTPWCRADNQPLIDSIVEDRLESGGRALYRVRMFLPRRP